MTDEVRLALHNKELEYKVLSCLMTYPGLLQEYAEVLSDRMFYYTQCAIVFSAIHAIYENGSVPDLLSVSMYLERNPVDGAPEMYEIADMSSAAVTSATFSQDVTMLAELAKRREYWLLGQRLMAVGTDATIDLSDIEVELDKVRERNLMASRDVYDMKSVNRLFTERISRNMEDDRATMVPTGFYYIDSRGGFQFTDFDVIGAATSQGKTTMALNILYNAARHGVPGMMFSLEMTAEQLGARINAPLCHISPNVMLYKRLYTDQVRLVEEAKAVTDSLPIYVDDSTTNYEKIKDGIRSNAIRRGVKLFMIDYLQILSTSRNGRESEAQFFERVSRELKNLAKERKVCIVVLSQMNRQTNETDPRPTLSKLKASSGIEQAADTVIMLYTPGNYSKRHKYRPELDPNTTTEVIIGKGRNIGGTGSFYVGYNASFSQFYDLESKQEDEVQQIPPATQTKLPF